MKLIARTQRSRPPATAGQRKAERARGQFTPAATLTRSSAIGARVKLLSWDTSSPSPEPANKSGITRYQPEFTLGTRG